MIPLFDSHCHLQDKRLDGVRDQVIADAIAAGVTGCCTCGTSPADWPDVAALESRAGFEIRRAFGLHPWFVDTVDEQLRVCEFASLRVSSSPQNTAQKTSLQTQSIIRETSSNSQTGGITHSQTRKLANSLTGEAKWLRLLRDLLLRYPDASVGEIGLDGIRKPAASEAQRIALRLQLQLASEFQRPVILHGAKVFDELLAECKPFKGKIPSFILHGFAGSREQLKAWLDFGAYISVGGAITKSAKLRNIVADIPRERLLIETDSPDLFPDGGTPAITGTKMNQPVNLILVRDAIELRQINCFNQEDS